MVYTIEYTNKLALEILILCSVSVVALLFTLYCYLKFEQLQNCQFKLVTRILISDLIYMLIMGTVSMTYFIFQQSEPLAETYPILCQTQAYTSTYAILSSCAWTSVICHTLYQQVFHMNQKIYYYQYNFIGHILPALIAYIPFYVNGYGIAYPMPQTNCFFNTQLNSKEFTIYIIIFYYIPIWIAFIYNCVIISMVVYRLRCLSMEADASLYALFVYFAILAICWVIPGVISQLNVKTEAWEFIVQCLSNSIGFLDALCYCFTEIFDQIEFVGWSLQLRNEEKSSSDVTLQINDQTTIANTSQQL